MNSEQMLSQMIKGTQVGQSAIETVLARASQPSLRQALKSQKKEYASLERQAKRLAWVRGFEPREMSPMFKTMCSLAVRSRLMSGDKDSRIAGMMIQGNTRGMIESRQNLGKYREKEGEVVHLAEKLLRTEIENIRQMEPFL